MSRRAPWLAVIVFGGVANGSAFSGPVPAAIGVALVAGLIACFLRFGLLGLLVALAVRNLWNCAVTDPWSAWYGQSAVFALVIFAAIALHGVWAAIPSGGGSRLDDQRAASSRGHDSPIRTAAGPTCGEHVSRPTRLLRAPACT